MADLKIYIQCSRCGFHFCVSPMLGIPDGMWNNGYRAVGDALYCPECVQTWAERNGVEFDEQIVNPSRQFANWWNSKVEQAVNDKTRIKKYRIVAGMYQEVDA